MGKITRRDFIKKSGMGTAAFMIVSNVVLGRSHGHVAPSDKLNIAGVGVGGMGRRNLQKMDLPISSSITRQSLNRRALG